MSRALPPSSRVLIDRSALATRVAAMGAEISRDYAGESLVIVCVLKGAFIFAADLVRAVSVSAHVDFLAVRSYEGTTSTGKVTISTDVSVDVRGRHVLVVEDIIDTGHTVAFLKGHFAARGARSLKICALLSKPEVHGGKCHVDYVGFAIPKTFVIGYGLDWDGEYRELPDVWQVMTESPQ